MNGNGGNGYVKKGAILTGAVGLLLATLTYIYTNGISAQAEVNNHVQNRMDKFEGKLDRFQEQQATMIQSLSRIEGRLGIDNRQKTD